jgi:hypothetical protein
MIMPNFRVSFKGNSVDLKGARRKNSLSGIIHPALVGAIEEASDEQIKQQFETNAFGVLNVTRAVLPIWTIDSDSGSPVSVISFALFGSLRIGYARLCDSILFMLIGSLYLVRCPFGADWFRR